MRTDRLQQRIPENRVPGQQAPKPTSTKEPLLQRGSPATPVGSLPKIRCDSITYAGEHKSGQQQRFQTRTKIILHVIQEGLRV